MTKHDDPDCNRESKDGEHPRELACVLVGFRDHDYYCFTAIRSCSALGRVL